MNLNRILITESEKQRILELHSNKKILIKEGRRDFPVCVRYAGKIQTVDISEYQSQIPVNIPKSAVEAVIVKDNSTQYSYYWLADPKIIIYVGFGTKKGQVSFKSYHCGCKNGKLKPITRKYDTKVIKDEESCNGTKSDEKIKDTDCKNKTPYNALTDAGLNWREESRKWIEAKCNGTTPCILGDAQTNSNLRNAFCDGTWGSKKEQYVQNPDCRSKCIVQPKEVPAGSIVTQQIGYFYDSIKGKCVGVTGQNGPFGSIAECEACKCGSQSTIGDGNKTPTDGGQNPTDGGQKPTDGGQKPTDGGQKPTDGDNKLPDFIPPTIDAPSTPLD